MKSLPLSLMRDRIEIQGRALTQGGTGAVTMIWSTITTVWGKVEPLSGREAWYAQMVRPDVTHKVTIRTYGGLTAKHRLKVGTRIFNISSVIDTENRGREQILMCVEEVA